MNFTTPEAVRQACRQGTLTSATAGMAAGFVQTNLIIVPERVADDFAQFCHKNPVPCPLIERLAVGAWQPKCAPSADIRTDLPGYRLYQHGRLMGEYPNIVELWQADLVAFLLGCSFSFEEALIHAGIPLRHVAEKRNVAMYNTNRACVSVGALHGNWVVSMRPIRAEQVAQVYEICQQFPQVHGAPIQVGAPEALGIADLSQPDYGDAVAILPGEVPVFWGCGVTPQAVVMASGIEVCVTHSPGKMLVVDWRNEALRVKPPSAP